MINHTVTALSVIQLITLQRDKAADHKECTRHAYHKTRRHDNAHDHQQQVKPEDLKQLRELIAYHKQHGKQHYDCYYCREEPLEHCLHKERRTYERLGRTDEPHCVYGKPAREHIQTYCIVYQHIGNKQQQCYEYSEHKGYLAEV